MTEAEWLKCADSQALAVFLYYRFRDQEFRFTQHKGRKLSLLACACLRRIWHLLTDERCRQAVEITERTAEGKAWDDACQAAYFAALDGWGAMAQEADERDYATPLLCAMPAAGLAAWHAIDGDMQCVGNAASARACFIIGKTRNGPKWETARQNEMQVQRQIISCIFGNPFRPVAVDSAWLTPTVVSSAQAAYDSRVLPAGTLIPDRLSVLADVLKKAGCSNSTMLGHLREPGPHVRGCWVVDLLLGKK
jgi:hypothetical protein